MELTLLTVPACPNAALFEERLAAALTAHPGTVVHRRVITDEREAADAGMHGSPSRLYRDASGRTARTPSVEALRQVLAVPGDA